MSHEVEMALPEGAVLVHVGPPKTGTTSIQASLEQHRAELLAHGVLYPGTGLRHRDAARALRGVSPRGTRPPAAGAWDELVEEVRSSTAPRVCVSAEELANASPAQVRRLVDDLGADRVHVLMAVRRLDRLLPSVWQQRVRNSGTETYADWVESVLDEGRDGRRGAFWGNHGVARLVETWRTALPADRITLLVLDEDDRTQLTATFSGLLGLPPGLLTPGPRENSSLSYERVELYRRVAVIAEERGWNDRRRRALMHRGLLEGLHSAPAHEGERSSPPMPAEAWARVVELADGQVEEVRASGVGVIGDPDLVRVVAPHDPVDEAPPEYVATDVVAEAVASLYETAARREVKAASASRAARRRRRRGTAGGVGDASTRTLIRELVRRPLRRRAGGRG